MKGFLGMMGSYTGYTDSEKMFDLYNFKNVRCRFNACTCCVCERCSMLPSMREILKQNLPLYAQKVSSAKA